MFGNRKFIVSVSTCLVFILLIACSTEENLRRTTSNLTVTSIHDTVIARKTSVKKLKELYGEPYKIETDSQKAIDLFNEINNDEGSINTVLEDNTDYWDTLKVDYSSPIKGLDFEGYYEYRGKGLAGMRVYFFIIKDTVRSYWFYGDITDKSVTKKDKYLRQILD